MDGLVMRAARAFLVVMAATLRVFAGASAAEPDELVYVPNSTQRVCQLTGDFDRAAGIPTLSQTHKRFGVIATDLGSSFEHKGKLYFLFGDTHRIQPPLENKRCASEKRKVLSDENKVTLQSRKHCNDHSRAVHLEVSPIRLSSNEN
jgi:hypothetical protein